MCSVGVVRIAVSRSAKLSGTKQPYEIWPRHVPMPGLRRPHFPFQGMLDVASQKPLRADEPVTQNDELGLRRVTVDNQTGAVGIETRVRFWCGLAACRAGFS